MAAEAVSASRWQATVAFIRDSYHEIRHKTTWPEFKQVQQASLYIIVFVLLVGLVITILDGVLHAILVQFIPSLFR